MRSKSDCNANRAVMALKGIQPYKRKRRGWGDRKQKVLIFEGPPRSMFTGSDLWAGPPQAMMDSDLTPISWDDIDDKMVMVAYDYLWQIGQD